MKKTIALILLGAMLLALLGACGSAAPSAPETASAAADSAAEALQSSAQESMQEPAAPEEAPEASAVEAEDASATEEVPEAEAASEAEEASEAEPEEVPAETDPETFFQDYLTEPAAGEMYAEVADKFELREYTDEETGLTVPYNFFVPENTEEPLPMIMCIGDATCAGTDPSYSLSQGYGGIIWATETEQAKRPCYVIVPAFPEVVIDDNRGTYVSDYVEVAARMVEAVAAENNVDTNRLYTTGQSMGCMTSLYLAANHPDLFAAELFVSGQWQMEDLQGLETQTFFYIAAGGDPKASSGQADVMADLDGKGVTYSTSFDWDANLDDAGMEEALRAEIAEGNAINIGQFAAGTVIEANNRGIEHMSSFDCAYKLDAVRAWLFAQSK